MTQMKSFGQFHRW